MVMLIKYLKIIFFALLLLFHSSLYSKNNNIREFNSKNLSDYFSALVSYDNQKNDDALKFFNSSNILLNKHDPYLKKYIYSLILNGQVDKSIKQLKINLDKQESDFFEAYLILILESIKRKDYENSNIYFNKLTKFKESGKLELAIYESLKSYLYLFENKKILIGKNSFENLSSINKAFQNCYINDKKTANIFAGLINNYQVDYSRYRFFYVNYLINHHKFEEAKKVTEQIDILNSTLLETQTKNWIEKKEYRKFNETFLCSNEADILAEFFFLIANLYSFENDYEKSNFFLNISNFLNPKFKFNLSLAVENYYINKDYKTSEKILKNFNKNDDIYYWYKIRKKAKIISKISGKKDSLNFINLKFKQIKQPSIKILFDMANITKEFKNYNIAISYYSEILSNFKISSNSKADILYRRGGSYERIKNFKSSDDDLLKSLEINPDNAYVLNYLAYSWLERKYKIDIAIKMLEKAYNLRKNDPFILDSVGWGYYLTHDFVKAEIFLNKAIQLMPDDPIVNDHYGDILWKLGRKVQAKYYWKSTLSFDETEDSMRKNIKFKLLKGLKKS